MSNDIYSKLVDLYAGRELSGELDNEMQTAARNDAELAYEMHSLRSAVDILKNDNSATFTEESYQRVLMRVYAKGGELQTRTQPPAHLQYQLPMQG